MNIRILTSILLIIFALNSFSAPIDQETAARVAGNFYFERSHGGTFVISDVHPVTSGTLVLMYLFNGLSGQGFVLVSGDDRVYPVPGYSLSGNYQTLIDEYNKYLGSVEYYEQQAIHEADIIVEQSTLSYKAGAMDYLEYILNLNRALEIKQNYLETLNNYNQTIINIEYITGKIF